MYQVPSVELGIQLVHTEVWTVSSVACPGGTYSLFGAGVEGYEITHANEFMIM